MKIKFAALAAIAALSLTACSAADPSSKDALPQADTSSSSSPAAAAPAKKKPAPAKPKASTCDVAREAILTGTKAELASALKALQKDKTADATAREYAQNYLVRDKGQSDLQKMDLTLIQTACSV